MHQNNKINKSNHSIMTRFTPFRIPNSQHLAPGSQVYTEKFMRKPDKSVRVSVIIPIFNEADTLPAVLAEINSLPFQTEIICVINGCQDESEQIARKSGARILEFHDALGHDVGRALGSSEANKADVYLFTDADIVIKAVDLALFVQAVYNGVDLALNDFSHILGTDALFHPVNICKYFLNLALRHGKLGPSSLTAIPHAFSRNAIEIIGYDSLSCPPLALVKAALNNLNIQAIHFVDISSVNKHTATSLEDDSLIELILGDHLEALDYLDSQLGNRAWFTDNVRRRYLLEKKEVIINEW